MKAKISDEVVIFYDLETTGLDPRKHSIHQLAGFVQVNGVKVEEFNILMRPHPKALIDPAALEKCNVTEKQIREYPNSQKDGYKKFVKMVSQYVDRFKKPSKAWLAGYNIARFDNEFLLKLFEINKDVYMFAYFFPDCWDVFVLASIYLKDKRKYMKNFKLETVAEALGIQVDKSQTHNAMYDVYLTHQVFEVVTGNDLL